MCKVRLLLFLLLWIVCGAACSKQGDGSPTDGQVIGSRYTNIFFRFTVDIPGGWAVGTSNAATSPTPGAAGGPKTQAPATAHQLLMLSEKPLGTSTPTNPSLLVMAEKTASVPGVKDAKDYLVRISQLMADAPIVYHPIRGITDIQLGGAPAVRLDFSARLNPQKTAHQSYVVSQREDHILSFILSGPSETEIRRLEQVLQTLKFH